MKLPKLLLTTSLCAAVALPALSQGRPFADVDENGDGALSRSELEAVFGTDAADRILSRGDRNGDDSLSLREARFSNDDESDDEEDDDEDDESDESDEEDDDENDESDDDEENDESDDDENDEKSDESDDDKGHDESDDSEDDED